MATSNAPSSLFFNEMSDDDWGNQQCDCTSSRAFPHRRKKCSMGGGKKPKSDGKPALSDRVNNAAQDGLVGGTQAGVAMGTATIVRDAMNNTVGAVVGTATDSFKSALNLKR